MGNQIFRENAEKYWSRDLRIIPVEPGTKQPAKGMKGWQGNVAAAPSEANKALWLEKYAGHGVGLLLGSEVVPGHLLAGIDVDDDRLVKVAGTLLAYGQTNGLDLTGKRGQKGATYFVLVPIGDGLKSTTLRGGGGLGNIDILAAGKMTVMPPTIHPDTGEPYSVVGTDLLDTPFNKLPIISAQRIKLLGKAIGSEHAVVLLGGESTHEAGVPLSATLVSAGGTDDEIEAVFRGLLPDAYSGNSLVELPNWIESARQKGFDQGTGGGSARANLTALIVTLALNSGAELFHDHEGDGFVTVPEEAGGTTYRIRSSQAERWLRGLVYRAMDKSPGAGPLAEAIATLNTIAFEDGPRRELFRRVAGDFTAVEIDLGRRDGRVVRIDPDGWRVQEKSGFKFVRGAGFSELPQPVPGAALDGLKVFLGLDDNTFRLLVAFLINALKPRGPYFILLIEGEQGSGKSFFAEIIRRIIDPNEAMRIRLPDNDRDLMIQMKEYWLPSFDNASGVKADMSDILCSVATGGGIAVRKLFTDGELNVMSFSRAFILNGIGGHAQRPDLMERSIPVRLNPMPAGSRKTESEMLAEFETMLPGIIAALYDAVSAALDNYEKVDPPRDIRMADAARWIAAAERNGKLGPLIEPTGERSMINAISEAQRQLVVDRISNDWLAAKLRAVAASKPFENYMIALFQELDAANDRALPKTPSQLSGQLERLRPSLEIIGIKVEILERDRKGRKVRITVDPEITGKTSRFQA